MAIGGWIIGSGIPAVKWILAGLQTVPITLFLGSVAFGLAAAVRGSSAAAGTAATLAVGGFILNGLVPLSDKLTPSRNGRCITGIPRAIRSRRVSFRAMPLF